MWQNDESDYTIKPRFQRDTSDAFRLLNCANFTLLHPHKPTKERLHRLWRTIRYFYGITSILSPNVKKRAVKTALNSTCYEYTRPKALSWSPQGLETNLVCSPSSSLPTPRRSNACRICSQPSLRQAYT